MTDMLSIRNLGIGEVRDLSLDIGPGEIACLSGPSGSGKTRILRAIADLEPHEGNVLLGDVPSDAMPGHEWRRAVMLVPAESQWWGETVREHCGKDRPGDLKALGMKPEVLDWSVARLSSGEKQRLALYRALSFTPRAWLLDEPTANLDEASKRRVEAWLTRHIRDGALPAIWVAHDPEQIQRVADVHYRLQHGRLIRDQGH